MNIYEWNPAWMIFVCIPMQLWNITFMFLWRKGLVKAKVARAHKTCAATWGSKWVQNRCKASALLEKPWSVWLEQEQVLAQAQKSINQSSNSCNCVAKYSSSFTTPPSSLPQCAELFPWLISMGGGERRVWRMSPGGRWSISWFSQSTECGESSKALGDLLRSCLLC